jgi:hypothetical protein
VHRLRRFAFPVPTKPSAPCTSDDDDDLVSRIFS